MRKLVGRFGKEENHKTNEKVGLMVNSCKHEMTKMSQRFTKFLKFDDLFSKFSSFFFFYFYDEFFFFFFDPIFSIFF